MAVNVLGRDGSKAVVAALLVVVALASCETLEPGPRDPQTALSLNVTAPLWLFIRAAYAVPFAVPSPGRSNCNHLRQDWANLLVESVNA